MKKKFFGALVVVAIAVGAMINVNLNKVSNKGDLAIANVEALAESEVSASGQWWNTSPANLTGLQFKGRESYSIRVEVGGSTTDTSGSWTANGTLSGSYVAGVWVPGASVGGTYNSGTTSTTINFITITCCRDSYSVSSCNSSDSHCA